MEHNVTSYTSSQATTESSIDEFIYESPNRTVIEYVEMPFSRVIATHKYCFLCYATSYLTLVPFEARLQVFTQTKIIIPKGNRCCSIHLIKKRFFVEELQNIRVVSDFCCIELQEVAKFMEIMSTRVDSSIYDKVGNYSVSDEQLKTFTSLNWENINFLTELLTSMRKSESRTVVQALVTFLFKLRSGNSNKLVSAILGLERE